MLGVFFVWPSVIQQCLGLGMQDASIRLFLILLIEGSSAEDFNYL